MTVATQGERCLDCRLFARQHGANPRDHGTCRLAPPIWTAAPTVDELGWAFPRVYPDDWCAQFQPRATAGAAQ